MLNEMMEPFHSSVSVFFKYVKLKVGFDFYAFL